MPGRGTALEWDRSDVVERCDGGEGRDGGVRFGGREGGSGAPARDEGAGAGRAESGGASGGARGDVAGAIGSSRAPTRSGFFFPWRAGPPLGAGSRGGRGRSPRDRGRERARLGDVARATTLRSSRGRGRTRSRRVGSATAPPARGARPGKAVARPGASAQPTAEPQKGEKSARDDSGKPSREGGARPRAPPKRESTSRARLRVDRVDGRARLRSATPVLTRATDRATHPFANLLPRGTSPRARRAQRQLARPKSHRQTVSFICTPPKFDRPMADIHTFVRDGGQMQMPIFF